MGHLFGLLVGEEPDSILSQKSPWSCLLAKLQARRSPLREQEHLMAGQHDCKSTLLSQLCYQSAFHLRLYT